MTPKEFERVIRQNDQLAALNPHAAKPEKRQSCRPTESTDKMTGLEKSFLHYWRLCGGDPLDWLYAQKIFPERPRMHVDFLHRSLPVAVEINGGQWQKRSGHNNGRGVQRDAEKLTLCNVDGLTLFTLTTDMVNFDEVAKILKFVEGKL